MNKARGGTKIRHSDGEEELRMGVNKGVTQLRGEAGAHL